MATRKEIVKVCDVCKKRVTDEGFNHMGSHPHGGWFAIEMHGGSTGLASLSAQRQWDVCGKECLEQLAALFAKQS